MAKPRLGLSAVTAGVTYQCISAGTAHLRSRGVRSVEETQTASARLGNGGDRLDLLGVFLYFSHPIYSSTYRIIAQLLVVQVR